MSSPESPNYVIVGRTRKVHGLRGELVVEIHTDNPDEVFKAGRRLRVGSVRGVVQSEPLEIVSVRDFKGGIIVKFAGIDDRNAAEVWKDRFLFLDAGELEPPADNEVYIHELKGMRVELQNGEPVGTVLDIYELPQGLALDVSRKGSKSIIIPYDHVVTSVDRTSRLVRIDPPEGMID